jgi:hypothetical protein
MGVFQFITFGNKSLEKIEKNNSGRKMKREPDLIGCFEDVNSTKSGG